MIMKNMDTNSDKYIFRRVRGRVIKIKKSPNQIGDVSKNVGLNLATQAGGALVGASLTAEAARHQIIHESKKFQIQKTKFAVQPFAWTNVGNKVSLYKKDGKKKKIVGIARYYKETNTPMGNFSWLSVQKEFRGKGFSEKIAKAAVKDLRAMGALYTEDNVIHPGSLKVGSGHGKESYWYIKRKYKSGQALFEQITKKQALKKIEWWQKRTDKPTTNPFIKAIEQSERLMFKKLGMDYSDLKESNVVRKVSLRKIKPLPVKKAPFWKLMPKNKKIQAGLGLGLLIGSAAYAAANKLKD